MKYLSYVAWFLCVAVVVLFVSVNSQPITLHYYLSQTTIVLPVLLLIVLLISFILVVVAFLPAWIRLKKSNHQLKRKVKALTTEVDALRQNTSSRVSA